MLQKRGKPPLGDSLQAKRDSTGKLVKVSKKQKWVGTKHKPTPSLFPFKLFSSPFFFFFFLSFSLYYTSREVTVKWLLPESGTLQSTGLLRPRRNLPSTPSYPFFDIETKYSKHTSKSLQFCFVCLFFKIPLFLRGVSPVSVVQRVFQIYKFSIQHLAIYLPRLHRKYSAGSLCRWTAFFFYYLKLFHSVPCQSPQRL